MHALPSARLVKGTCRALTVLALLTAPSSVVAADCYYMLIFSAQKCGNPAKYAHSFGAFVKVKDRDRCQGPHDLEITGISWLPQTLDVHPYRRRPETGVNLELHATVQWCLDNRTRVSVWGPFEIDKELYRRATIRRDLLEGNTVLYRAIDKGARPLVVDCMHALSGVDVDPGIYHTRSAHGDIASYFVLCHLQRWIVDPPHTHEWVYEMLCLDQYPIVRRCGCERPKALLPILPPYYTEAPVPPEETDGVEAPAPDAVTPKTDGKKP